ncbi:UTRA domain-containing protein [Streptosporangium sandarakinum]|uniref:UTRA domain-containing protein n=1 Tax=Streptosporangium sandarakinum TaxID=1260955 RepID=UPI0034341AA1
MVAALLGLEPKAKAFLRRRPVGQGGEPTETVSPWVPVELSQGTDLTSAEPLPQGLREHLRSRKGVRFDHIVEQITARMPTADEAKRLGMPKNTPLPAVYGAVRGASGTALAARGRYCSPRTGTSWKTPIRSVIGL